MPPSNYYLLRRSTHSSLQLLPFTRITWDLVIPDRTTSHANYNMRIAHTKEVRLFREVTGVGKALIQQIVGTVEEDYMMDIRNRIINSINNTVTGALKHLQDKYGQLMPHELLEREYIVKKTIYSPRDPIATVFSAFKEFFEFNDITDKLYTKLQAVNI